MATEALAKRSSDTGPSNSQAADGCVFFWEPPAWTITDPQERIVEGYASLPNLDDQGDVIPLDTIAEALPSYMEFANLREMHGKSAAGNVLKASVDEKGLYIVAKVVDDDAWAKVKAGVYKGFSVGGGIPDDMTETRADGARIIKQIQLNEISLVDRPANPKARISFVKFEKWSGGRSQLTAEFEKWTTGRTATMMHARGTKRHKAGKCEKHKKENCEECGCDRTVEHPGTSTTSGMASRPAGAEKAKVNPKRISRKSLNAAAKRFGTKTAEKASEMKLLQKAATISADPKEVEALKEAQRIIEKYGLSKAQEWHTQRDVGARPNSEAEVGVELEDNDAGSEEPVEDVIDKAQESEGEGEAEGEEKASGSPMSHMKACHKSIQACHKAFGEEDHPGKAHAAAALEHCHKAMKCFGAQKSAESTNLQKVSSINSGLEERIETLEESLQYIANVQTRLVEKFAGLPRSRAPMPTETFDKDQESRTARLSRSSIN
jgi:HK97 family phage prohead protease